MTYRKGVNIEEEEFYRERILKSAKPRTAKNYLAGWDEKIEQFRQNHYEDEEINYSLSIAQEWLVADRVVGYPLHAVVTFIRTVVRLKEPWININTKSGSFPLLTIDQIYKCLRPLCDENKGMVFAQLESTDYDVRQRMILSLKKERKWRFRQLAKTRLSPSDTLILSNICWNHELAEAAFVGFFDGTRHYLFDYSRDAYEVEKITPSDIRSHVKNTFASYSWDRGFYESSNNKEYFSEEDRQVIDEILARPEGKPLDDLYRKFKEFNNERRRQLGLIDNPEEQEQPEFQPSIVQHVDQKPKAAGVSEKVGDNYVPHWPSDEELNGYDNATTSLDFFTDTIFGVAGNVKASDIKKLFDVLASLGILQDDIETQLIFLARYSGKAIPNLSVKPIEWKMLDDKNRERTLGYLFLRTANAQYSKGCNFFYYIIDDKKIEPNVRAVSEGAHALNKSTRRETTKTLFEKRINKFLDEYTVIEV